MRTRFVVALWVLCACVSLGCGAKNANLCVLCRQLCVTPCKGDCDGDGKVTNADVLVARDIASGSKPLSECPGADVDGDGQVTINDLTSMVIATQLGECAKTK
jgi:hypothetical protein